MTKVRQAGAIAVRGTPPGASVLLVRAKKNLSRWIFPKGHIEAGESAEDAALRELQSGENSVDGHKIVVAAAPAGGQRGGRGGGQH